MKQQIIEVSVLRDTIIKIDIGLGALYNIFIDQVDVINPTSINVNDLRDKIIAMLQASLGAGLATEAKQSDQLTEMQNIKNIAIDMRDKIGVVSDKLFFEPLISDESNPNVIYKGFAIASSGTNVACWAIQKISNLSGILKIEWAAGNKNFDKVWDNRKTLVYS
jgi:hypothetical protein